MIQFKNWQLEWDGAPMAMQFDNDSVRLEIVGAVSYTHLRAHET